MELAVVMFGAALRSKEAVAIASDNLLSLDATTGAKGAQPRWRSTRRIAWVSWLQLCICCAERRNEKASFSAKVVFFQCLDALKRNVAFYGECASLCVAPLPASRGWLCGGGA